MAIRFICPHCGHVIFVADSLDGRQGQCPNCNRFAMIQGQHIPDSNVAGLVDIATAPDSRTAAASGDRTQILRSSQQRMPGVGAAPPGPMGPMSSPPTRVPTPLGSRSMASGITAAPMMSGPMRTVPGGSNGTGYQTMPSAMLAPEEEEYIEEEGGVGVKKLVLSILSGAVAAALIGFLLYRIVLPPVEVNPEKDKNKDKDAPPVAAEYYGPIFKIRSQGKVAVVVILSSHNADDQMGFVKRELQEFLRRLTTPDLQNVTEYTFVFAGAKGLEPEVVHGTPADARKSDTSVDRVGPAPLNPDMQRAFKVALDRNPNELIVISDKELESPAVADLEKGVREKKVVLYAVGVVNEDVKKTIMKALNFDSSRWRYFKVEQRVFDPPTVLQ